MDATAADRRAASAAESSELADQSSAYFDSLKREPSVDSSAELGDEPPRRRGNREMAVRVDSLYSEAQAFMEEAPPNTTEALQLMKEGARYRFFIPPGLAYGSRGAGLDIGPDETLIFEVELLKVWED